MIINSVLNVEAVVAAFNQEKALVGAFSVITNLRMELFQALLATLSDTSHAASHLHTDFGVSRHKTLAPLK